MKLNVIQQMMVDTGMLQDIKTLEVNHDRYPENEILINADCWCDIGGHKVPEWMLQNIQGDASVCEDCYDNFN